MTEADVRAARAVAEGKASADQQKAFNRWLLLEACGMKATPYVADGLDRETFIAIGRHQVGQMVIAMGLPSTLDEARKAAPEPKAQPKRQTT